MAAPGSAFKMKCPSCEAGVTIRDATLVGKKVECPKCKFRFVVEVVAEKPAEGSDEKPAAKTKPVGSGVTSGKNKPLPKRNDDAADGVAKKKLKKQKKAKSNLTLIIGGGLGVLAIGILAVAYFGGLFDDDTSSAPVKTGEQAKVVPKKDATGDPTIPDPKKVDITPNIELPKVDLPKVKIDPVAADITNLLPDDSEWVMHVSGPEFVNSPIGSVLFDESGDAGKAFRRWMGFAGTDVERLACSGSSRTHFFGVLRFKADVKMENLQAAMDLDPSFRTVGRYNYYVIKSNELFRMMGDYMSVKLAPMGITLPKPGTPQPLALSLTDPRTLVIADKQALEDYLKGDLKRRFRTTYIRPETIVPPTKVIKDAKEPKEPKEGGPKKAEGETPKKEVKPAFTSNPSFLTVDPSLKVMMFQLEEGKPALLGLATRVPNFDAAVKQVAGGQAPLGLILPKSPVIGIAVRRMNDVNLDVVAGVEFDRPEDAGRAAQTLQPTMTLWVTLLSDLFKTQIGVGGQPTVPPMPKMIDANERMLNPIIGRFLDLATPPGAEPRTIPVFQGGVRPGGEGQPSPQPGKDDPNVPPALVTSTLTITTADRFLLVKLNVDWFPVYHDYISPSLRTRIDMLRGEALMLTGRALWHTLPDGIAALKQVGTTPPAAFPRPLDPARLGVPFPPDQRVSWMVNLLPSLGYDTVSRAVRRDEAWNNSENLNAGAAWIPEFLSRDNPPASWRALVPSLKGLALGATHFVGMAGVGVDAANLADTPENASKLGMLGYNRQTNFADVTDGLGNTIFMIQVPPNLQRAWIRGGGSTVQGVPETGSIKPFVTATSAGKKGTHILMADGSIRFLSETADDAIVKALSTYKGGEKIDRLDVVAPLVTVEAKLMVVPRK